MMYSRNVGGRGVDNLEISNLEFLMVCQSFLQPLQSIKNILVFILIEIFLSYLKSSPADCPPVSAPHVSAEIVFFFLVNIVKKWHVFHHALLRSLFRANSTNWNLCNYVIEKRMPCHVAVLLEFSRILFVRVGGGRGGWEWGLATSPAARNLGNSDENKYIDSLWKNTLAKLKFQSIQEFCIFFWSFSCGKIFPGNWLKCRLLWRCRKGEGVGGLKYGKSAIYGELDTP